MTGRLMHRTAFFPFFVACLALVPCDAAAAGELTLSAVDAQTGQPIACRMHLRNAKGRPQRVPKLPFLHDHFVFAGKVKLKLARGNYTFLIERGPEYVEQTGHFTINDFAEDEHVVQLRRAADMASEGWWSADLDVHRPLEHLELLMQAEDLHLAAVAAWGEVSAKGKKNRPAAPRKLTRFDGNRFYAPAGQLDRPSGGLTLLNLPEPVDLAAGQGDSPLPLAAILAARTQPNAWIDVRRPASWDLPVWLAAGAADSLALAHAQMRPDGVAESDPRDHAPAVAGTDGRPIVLPAGPWTQQVYYHALNCGLRIVPSAGSGSGSVGSPIGYNRVYAWVDPQDFSHEAWFEAFDAGRVVVTNGPLMRPLANGRHPGHVLRAAQGETLSVDVVLNFATRDPISYFELVKDGRVALSVRYEDLAKTGHFPPIEFDSSGWFLVRVVADVAQTYRFASSGPWYVEIGEEPRRISRGSAEFFLDWMGQRADRLKPAAGERADHDQALEFWQGLVETANAP